MFTAFFINMVQMQAYVASGKRAKNHTAILCAVVANDRRWAVPGRAGYARQGGGLAWNGRMVASLSVPSNSLCSCYFGAWICGRVDSVWDNVCIRV